MKTKLIPQFELPNTFSLELIPTQDGDRIQGERVRAEHQARERESDLQSNEARQLKIV